MQVIPEVHKESGKRTTAINARHREYFRSCIAYPILDFQNVEATKDGVLGILEIYCNQEKAFPDSNRDKEIYELILSGFSARIIYESWRFSLKTKLKL